MPYITSERREVLDMLPAPEVAGELNYIITQLLIDYVDRKGLCYQTLNDIGGVMHYCGLEFYERIVRPYEDKKIKENGDVYPRRS